MRIGLFSDSHYSSQEITNQTRRPRLSYAKIQEAMEHFRDVDLVICLGDLVDHSGERMENERRLQEIAALIHSYSIPFYSLMGNHDCDMFTSEEFDRLAGGCIPPFCVGLEEKTLIFLNANYTRSGSAYVPGDVDWTDTAVPTDQVDALRCILDSEETKDAYVFVHQNLDPDVQWQHIIGNAAEIREILSKSAKVRRVVQGHYHPGHDNLIDGIEYHTLRAMCEGESNSFEIMDI